MNIIYSLEQILPLTLKSLGITRKFTVQSIYTHWEEIVGKEIAAHSNPRSTQNAILFISVINSSWCHHLTMMKEQIIDKINTFAGEKIVNDIRFHAGYLKNKQNEEGTVWQEPTLKEKLQTVTIDNKQMQTNREISNAISDEQLRKKVFKLITKDSTLQELKKRENWHKCSNCSTLCPPEDKYCTVCAVQKRQSTIESIRKLLMEVPWINYTECRKYIECTSAEFGWAKKGLIDSLVNKSVDMPDDSVCVATLVMLLKRVKPEELFDELISSTLKSVRRKKYVFTHRG